MTKVSKNPSVRSMYQRRVTISILLSAILMFMMQIAFFEHAYKTDAQTSKAQEEFEEKVTEDKNKEPQFKINVLSVQVTEPVDTRIDSMLMMPASTTTSTTTTTTTVNPTITTTSTITTTDEIYVSETEEIVEETIIEEDTYVEEYSEPITEYEETTLSISESEFIMLCNVVGHEYGSDWVPIYDKALVVEVVMNRVNSPSYPNTIYEVLTAPYQFSGAWGYVNLGTYSYQVTESVKEAVNYYFNNPDQFQHGYLTFSGDGYQNYFS